MKVLATTFTIELTKDEIEILTMALHDEYKFCKDLQPDNIKDRKRIEEKTENTRELRNNFAGLIAKSYMGEDA